MFLVERLFAVAVYVLLLLAAYFLIAKSIMRPKQVLVIYTFALCVMAFLFIPYKTADLHRIYEMAESFGGYTLGEFVRQILQKRTSPLAYLLYWLAAKSGEPRLLPAITTLVVYSCVFYIILKTSEKYNIGCRNIATVLFFFMSTGNYMMVISNIRTMLAIALLCLCFFRETVLKEFKLWHLIVYIAAALIHNLAAILIAIRLLAALVTSNLSIRWKVVLFFASCGLLAVVSLRFSWFISSIVEKATGYLGGDTYSYMWEYVIAVLALLAELYALWLYRRQFRTQVPELIGSYRYLQLCLLPALILCFQFSIFHRLVTYISPILALPLLLVIPSGKSSAIRRNNLFVLSVIMLFIACFRGSLCSLKFFVM